MSKYHCDFITEFIFNDTNIIEEEDEELNSILNSSKLTKEEKKLIKKNHERQKKKEKEMKLKQQNTLQQPEKEYPTFFKHVRINQINLKLSIFFYEKSKFVNFFFFIFLF